MNNRRAVVLLCAAAACLSVLTAFSAGCKNIKDVSDGIGKGSTGVASSVGASAQGALQFDDAELVRAP